MIIRILGEGQFRPDDKHMNDLNKIDNRIVDYMNRGNQTEFMKELDRLISAVKESQSPWTLWRLSNQTS